MEGGDRRIEIAGGSQQEKIVEPFLGGFDMELIRPSSDRYV